MFSRVHRRHVVNVTRIVSAPALAGGVFGAEWRGGIRVQTGRRYSGAVRRLLEGGS
jgi:DNA-binding LytR/AlgR family response regulator